MEKTYESALGALHLSDPELYINNETRHRSGHMTHAMVEYAPGKIIDFNSNCAFDRCGGHSAFGYVEYRYSEDYGKTWSGARLVQPTMDVLLQGIYTHSIEKAVASNGILTCFALRNTQGQPICCEPWETPQVIQSYDMGKTWEQPFEFCPWRGRIYDAKEKDGVIYVIQSCNPNFIGKYPDDLYRLFVSTDNGKSFSVRSVIDIEPLRHGYGALQFRKDGTLLAYACDIADSYHLSVSLSDDLGKTWKRLPDIILKHGIRNVQISALEDGFVMHGRAYQGVDWGKGQVVYASRDGLNWDDGLLLESEKRSCYYSNTLLLKEPGQKEKVLVQYSDTFDNFSHVNVMHMFLNVG